MAPTVADDDQLNNQELQGEATGSLGKLTDQLNTANDALHGPVALERNEECQLVVTYTNETPTRQYGSGIAMPYEAVQRHGLDQVDPATVEATKLVA